ncbi:MAG TPA: MMPL family transporter [Solirubrobacterales bacterium]|nr:MMPL family transporter [Solirubrobacterales bacterium]
MGGDPAGGGFGLGRPRLTLALAVALIAVLGAIGWGVEGKLGPTSLSVPGTPSAAGESLLREEFGDSAPFVVLLRGPAAALDRQGPRLVAALRRVGGATTLSPWDRGHLARLRPGPRRALVLVDFHVGASQAVRESVPQLDAILAARTHPPVEAVQTGFATLSRAIRDESVQATRVAELVAVPILLLVLLLVFRSPVAAAIPLLFGGATVLTVRGLLSLAASDLAIDGFALTVATMMGLALGVDYALLMVSRFREELAAGRTPLEAATRTRRSAGRTTAYAGFTLLLAMVVILVVMPGTLFLSLAGTAILTTVVSVAVSTLLAPPLLLLLGRNVDRWRLGRGNGGARLMAAVSAALSRPLLAVVLIGGALILLALPALSLKTGPPSATQLPQGNQAREDSETVDDAIGAGWDAPFVLAAATNRGPITSRPHLTALRRAQHQVADDPAVQAVVGPGQIQRQVRPLQRRGNELLAEEGAADPARLEHAGRQLDRAAGGVGRLRGGFSEAAAGAGLLATGSRRAEAGAEKITGGLDEAAAGAGEAERALGRIDRGSGRLADGQHRAATGSASVRNEIAGLLPIIRASSLPHARRLRSELRAASATDPSLANAVDEAEVLVARLEELRDQASKASARSKRLHEGQQKLAEGGDELHAGAAKLSSEARALSAGLGQLRSGSSQLSFGLQQLAGGADALSGNLANGAERSQPLQTRLGRAGGRARVEATSLSHQVGELRSSSPRIFDSGSFVLSALEGAPPAERRRAGQVVSLSHGGQGAQILVIPRYTFDTPGSKALYARLRGDAAGLARHSGLRTGVSGGPAQLADYSEAISARVPWAILAISLATFLVLVLVLGAIPLAAIAVALNLLTVGVAFGVLALLFDVPAGWPLGGHSYVDAIGAAGIFGIVFGLSIDYAVFLLTRMRESRAAGASNEEAVAFGLRRTAAVITGAAAIMVAVFVAFAAAPIATVSQLGTGLTVAVVLDATVVRIVLLPALMLLIGERVWWLPRPLQRLLPRSGLHAA